MYQIQELIEAKLYDTQEDLINDAIRNLFINKPELKIKLAIHKYNLGMISLSKAASVAGLSWIDMKELLIKRGIKLHLGCETEDEINTEVQNLLKLEKL